MAVQLRRFTPDVTLVTNNSALGLTPEAADRLARRGLPVVIGRITCGQARAGEPGMLASLRLEDGRELPAEHLFSHQGATPQTALARSLGVALSGGGYINVDTEQRTAGRSIYAAGDCTRLLAAPDRDGGARGRDGGTDAQLRPVPCGRAAGGGRGESRLTGSRRRPHYDQFLSECSCNRSAAATMSPRSTGSLNGSRSSSVTRFSSRCQRRSSAT